MRLPLTAGCSTCLGDALKSPQCRYRNVRDEPKNGDLNTLSPAFVVCGPSKKKRQDPGPIRNGQWEPKNRGDGEDRHTVISFNESHTNPTRVWYDGWNVHGQWVDPFGVHGEHV